MATLNIIFSNGRILNNDDAVILYFAPVTNNYISSQLPISFTTNINGIATPVVDLQSGITIASASGFYESFNCSVQVQDMIANDGIIPVIDFAVITKQRQLLANAPVYRLVCENTLLSYNQTELHIHNVFERNIADIHSNPTFPYKLAITGSGVFNININVGVFRLWGG